MNKHLLLAKELTSKLDLPMKICSVEEDEEGSLTFRFSSENRVDLRDLIKKLQEETDRKIILNQVGEREEAKFLTGVGFCGRKLCCATFLKTSSVLISSDKTGDEETGVCGKSLCCLAFEGKKVADEKVISSEAEIKYPPQNPPKAIVTSTPSPQRILRVLPQRKSRHHRR